MSTRTPARIVSAVGLAVSVSMAGFVPSDSANRPSGTAAGVSPGRVVVAHDTTATAWRPGRGHFFDDSCTNAAAVKKMLSRSLQELTGKKSDAEAWKALFTHYNAQRGRGAVSYRKGERVAVKLNLNASQTYEWKKNAQYPSPQLVAALLEQLVRTAGVPDSCITVGDPSRLVGDPLYDRCHALFPGVRFVDSRGEKGRVRARPDTTIPVFFSDTSVTLRGRWYLASFLTQADYHINLAELRGHSLAGVTLCAKNHVGSIWKSEAVDTTSMYLGRWGPTARDPMVGLHGYLAVHDFDMSRYLPGWKWKGRAEKTYSPLVDLMGHQHLGAKTLLYMIDGLYASPHQSADTIVPWSSAPFGTPQNPDWTSAIFLSQDGVALESVALDFLRSEPAYDSIVVGTVDNYLHEAAQAGSPPSRTVYDPEGDRKPLKSLGVHEHWNNARERKYSRNLGKGQGIELRWIDVR